MGYVATEHAAPGTLVDVEILGELYTAQIQGEPLYDPKGFIMRC